MFSKENKLQKMKKKLAIQAEAVAKLESQLNENAVKASPSEEKANQELGMYQHKKKVRCEDLSRAKRQIMLFTLSAFFSIMAIPLILSPLLSHWDVSTPALIVLIIMLCILPTIAQSRVRKSTAKRNQIEEGLRVDQAFDGVMRKRFSKMNSHPLQKTGRGIVKVEDMADDQVSVKRMRDE